MVDIKVSHGRDEYRDARLEAEHKAAREAEAERAELWTESDEEDFRRGQYWDQRIDEARGK